MGWKRYKRKGINSEGKIIIECKRKYFRPLEVDNLLGNSKKARKILKWKPKYNIHTLVDEMIAHELEMIHE